MLLFLLGSQFGWHFHNPRGHRLRTCILVIGDTGSFLNLDHIRLVWRLRRLSLRLMVPQIVGA